jgi:hypothetical protein
MRVTTIGRALSAGLLLASSAVATLGGAAESVHQLNEDNFDEKVSRGLWFVTFVTCVLGQVGMF